MADPINCPFCGGATICDRLPTGYHQVFCRSVLTCGAAGGPRPTPEEAIAVWNRRAGQHVQATEAALSWRCFHCDYVARTRDEGFSHFGLVMNESQPSCTTALNAAIDDVCDWLDHTGYVESDVRPSIQRLNDARLRLLVNERRARKASSAAVSGVPGNQQGLPK